MTRRGQTLVFMALTMLLVVVMACMTLSITSQVRRKLELQTVADTAAYNNAVATARGFNAIGLINRTVVSHWVVMLGIEANISWGSTVPAYFDAFAKQLNEMRFEDKYKCRNPDKERERGRQLQAAREAFLHASMSVWNGPGAASDPVAFYGPGCPGGKCFDRLPIGLGTLDKKAAEQSRWVWRSVRDLVEVQRDLQRELQDVLKDQTLATQATLAAQGKRPSSVDTFPFKVERGAPAVTALGVAGRPPGWREVSSALGTTHQALLPMAHAVMGSRGSRFVSSNKHQQEYPDGFKVFTPRRAKIYAQRIERVMNNRFGRGTFAFRLSAGNTATFPDTGDGDFDDGDVDDTWQYVEEVEEATGDGPEEIETAEPTPEASEVYDVNKVTRVTPARSIGWKYATSRQSGKLRLVHNGPCGTHQNKLGIATYARSHTDMGGQARSQHEWWKTWEGRQHFNYDTKDHTGEFSTRRSILHGAPQGNGHGYEEAGHRPEATCHAYHRHRGEANDRTHTLGKEIDGLGIAPGGFGFVFPQTGPDPDSGLDRDGASGAFGQPKLPVLITRAGFGQGLLPDPWNLSFRFSFASTGNGQQLDLAKKSDPTPMAALATGIAYYHRRCDSHQNPRGKPNGTRAYCKSWKEPPNLLNPFWRATLVPIDVDEQKAGRDETPGNRLVNEAGAMLEAAGLDQAQRTHDLLLLRGYEGVQ